MDRQTKKRASAMRLVARIRSQRLRHRGFVSCAFLGGLGRPAGIFEGFVDSFEALAGTSSTMVLVVVVWVERCTGGILTVVRSGPPLGRLLTLRATGPINIITTNHASPLPY